MSLETIDLDLDIVDGYAFGLLAPATAAARE
jgi:hypothetical protein